MSLMQTADGILSEVRRALSLVDDTTFDRLADLVHDHPRVFIVGMGRSRLVGQMFAMRLVQMGLTAYVIGDALTPAITEEDLLIAISGSGRTWFTHHAAVEAREIGSTVVSLTAKKDSPLANVSDLVIHIPAKTKLDLSQNDPAPLGTAFELSALVFLDALVAHMQQKFGITEEEMFERHAVIE